MAESNSQEPLEHNADYPHYDKKYRGLPTEIRMLIWRYAIGPRVLCISPSPRTEDYGNFYDWDGELVSSPPRWKNFIDNFQDFNFGIFFLNKEVNLEVMVIAKDKLIWNFTASHYGHTFLYLLGHLSPLQKHMIGEISIASASLMDRSDFTRIHGWLALTEPYNLTIRLTPPDDPYRSLILRGYIGRYPSSEVETELSKEFQQVFWHEGNARMVYHFLHEENVRTFKLEYYQAYEELRPYFSDPLKVLFDNQRFRHYLSVNKVDSLHVELEWPINSKLLSVRITKRVQEDGWSSALFST